MADAKKKSFVMYQEWAMFAVSLPMELSWQFSNAIYCYQLGQEYEIEDIATRAYFESIVKPVLDQNERKYRERVENGSKGGAPKGNKNAEKTSAGNQKQPKTTNDSQNNQRLKKQPDNDNDNDNDNEDVNDYVDVNAIKANDKSKANDKNKKTKSARARARDDPRDAIPEDLPNELRDALFEFVAMRKKKRNPMTYHAMELLISKTRKMSDGDVGTAVKLLNQSIEAGWQSIYPLKDDKQTGKGRTGWIDDL